MSSSDEDFARLVTASAKRNKEKRRINRATKGIKLNFDSPKPSETERTLPRPTPRLDSTGGSDGLESFLDKLRLDDERRKTPKYPNKPVTPMHKFIVPDHESDSDDFEKTSIIQPDPTYSSESSDDEIGPPAELEKTVEIVTDEECDSKENIRAKARTVRLPSGKDDEIFISSDEEFVIKKTPKKQYLTPSNKTPKNRLKSNDLVILKPCTPEDVRRALAPKTPRMKTPKSDVKPLTPLEKILKKDAKIDFSPASRRKKEKARLEEGRRLRAELEEERRLEVKKTKKSLKITKCGIEGCIMEECDTFAGKHFQLQTDWLILELYKLFNK